MMKDIKTLQEGVSMVKCEICGKELKNTQGLNGHKRFAHGQATSKKPAGAAIEQSVSELELTPGNTQPSAEQQLSELERRLQKLERVTGLRSSDLIELLSGTELPLTNQLASITQQLSKQAEQLSKLSDDVELARVSKTMMDADKEYHDNRLEELNQKFRESHNELVAVVNSNVEQLKQAIDAFNSKFSTTERDILETNKRLDKVEAQRLKDRDESKSIEQTVNSVKADIDDIRLRMLRKPTDGVATLRLTDGRDHRFREYRDPQGLRRPHKTSTDWIFGDKFVDLSEPED